MNEVRSSSRASLLLGLALLAASACGDPVPGLAAAGAPARSQEEAGDAAPTLAVEGLSCEHAEEPLALETRAPRFSWKLRALDPARRGLAQSAWRILVGTSTAELAREQGSLWDSGQVASRETVDVEYAGRALASFEHAFWCVRVWDQDGVPSAWSAPARFATGALEPGDWQARWIAHDAPQRGRVLPDLGQARWLRAPGGEREIALRHHFTVTDEIDPQAVLVVSAADEYELSLNGQPLLKGGSNHGVRRNAEIVKVATRLVRGPNVLAARVRTPGEAPAALALRLLVVPARGVEVRTDETWRASPSAPAGFVAPDFDDSAWPAAVPVADEEPWLPVVEGPAAFLPPPRLLRTEFRTRARPVRATLLASALGVYSIELNGERAHDDWLAPGWTDYEKRIPYRAYDVTALVRAGPNALGVVLADGWYAGLLGKRGQRNHYGEKARFLGQLVLEHADGTRELVTSGPDWRATTGPFREADLFMGERYDARLEFPGWSRPGFDASAWQPVEVGAAPAAPLVAHPGPPIRVLAELAPVEVVELAPGRLRYDFGQNLAGVVRCTLSAPRGTSVVLRFAEALEADGSLMRRNLTWARASDQYFCRGEGRETWTPRFTYHGFRYVEALGLPPGMRPELTALALSSATRDVGRFRASEPELERLVEAARWTMRANTMDLPTDSPQRGERLGWTGDAQLFAPSALWLADLQAFYDKWCLDLLDAQREDGRFPNTAPSFPGMPPGGPAWEDAGVLVPALLFEVYGDRRLAERHLDSMTRFVASCERRAGTDLAPPEPLEGYGDWRHYAAETPREVLWQAYLARSTRQLARVARALGREPEAERLEQLLVRVRTAAAGLVDLEGRVRGETQTGYALALREGLVPELLRARAAERLAGEVERRGHLTTGFVGTPELLPALSGIGRADLAYRLLLRRELPSWRFMLEQGATTLWERWDAWTPDHGFADEGRPSLSHTPFASYVAWLFEECAGMRPAEPGFRSVAFAPTPGGGLTWAEASHDSVRGELHLRWEQGPDGLEVEVHLPPNVSGTLALPHAAGGLLEGERPAAEAVGVRELGRLGSRLLLGLEPGRYRFRARARD